MTQVASRSLVGRGRELRRLEAGLRAAAEGDAVAFVIVGEPGMGKTALADSVSAQALERGFVVAHGGGWEGGDAPPYWPWIQLLRHLLEGLPPGESARDGGEISAVVARLQGGDARGAGPRGGRFSVWESVAATLSSLAAQHPLFLVLDDLHAADESSLLLFQFVVRTLKRARIAIVGTFSERAPGATPAVKRLLADITRDSEPLVLAGLDEDDVAAMYQAMTGARPPDVVRAAVYRASEGTPFFVQEAVRLLLAKGELHRPDYSVGFRVPDRVKELVRRRVEVLSDAAQALLSVSSVLGRTFDLTLLAAVSGVEPGRATETLEEAVAGGILVETSASGRFSFAHILMRETIYESLTIANRMKLHRRTAEVLEQLHEGDLASHLPELAHHWFKAAQAGDPKKTLDYSVRAARAAEAALAHADAVHLYHRALTVAEQARVGSEERERLEDALAAAQQRQAGAQPDPDEAAEDEMLFVREGDYWTARFAGKTARLKDVKGLGYIAQLLANPGREIHALDLAGLLQHPSELSASSAAAAAAGLEVGAGDAAPALDATAKTQYKRRLDELAEELEEARSFNDPERAAAAQVEIEALTDEISRSVGLGGRDRKPGSPAERARVNVTKTVKDALRRIEGAHPDLFHHLAATIRTGTYCVYVPDPRIPADWKLS